MNRLMLTVAVMVGALAVQAMPTKVELTAAQPLVEELMAEDVAAFKAKTKTAEQVGDVSVKYAESAETEAAKFLLLKGAVSYYARGEAYDKAADAVNALCAAVPNVSPEVLEDVLKKSVARTTVKKAPRLYAQYRTAQVQVAAADTARAVKSSLSKKPKDEALMRKLAEAQAISGDWQSALDSFSGLGDKSGLMAKSEKAGKDVQEVADFWWAYESYLGEKDADLFKLHAVAMYKKLLAANEIDGLKKSLIEKRVKQFDSVLVDVSSGAASKSEGSTASISNGKPQGKPIVVKLNNKVSIEFVQCPAGSFIMGRSSDPDDLEYKHKVVITRPFWMSKYPITVEQFDVFCPVDKEFIGRNGPQGKSSSPVCTTIGMVDRYCQWMNKRFKSSLPAKCVFRLPSDAEWEYALFANSTDDNDPYVRFRDGEKSAAREIWGEAVPGVPVGKSGSPNVWGLYDMLGNGAHYVLDTIPNENAGNYSKFGRPTKLKCGYSETETDPLRWVEGAEKPPRHLMRGALYMGEPSGPNMYVRMNECGGLNCFTGPRMWTFRLVVGPDLVSEWKAKHGKK